MSDKLNIDGLLKLWAEKSEPKDITQIRNNLREGAELCAMMVEEFEQAGFSRVEALLLLSEFIKANIK